MKAEITNYERQYVDQAQRFLDGVAQNPQILSVLNSFGLSDEERERGARLTDAAARALEWEEAGIAWNFLSPTVKRRKAEAKSWYQDARRRHLRTCYRTAEEESGWSGEGQASCWPSHRKLTVGTLRALPHLLRMISLRVLLAHRADLRRNLRRAAEQRPAEAPPPKDSALAELGGWFERWRLLAQRVFRQQPELLTALGLSSGKAPPRLRGPRARAEFGESSAAELLARVDGAGQPESARPDSATP